MKVVATKALWLEVVNALSSFADKNTIQFELKPDGLHSTMVDTAHVMMANLHMVSEDFQKYEIDDEHGITFDTSDFYAFIRTAQKDEAITMEEVKTDVYRFRIGNLTKTFKNLKAEFSYPKVPQKLEDLVNHIILPSTELRTSLKACAMIMSDAVNIIVDSTEKQTKMVAEDRTDSVEVILSKSCIREHIKDPSHSTYNMDMFESILKGIPTTKEVRLLTGLNTILKIEMIAGTKGYCHFYLAPRIETDD